MARFTYPCPMRWSDMDAYGHVNNVRFLTYLEEARVEMIFNLTQDGAASDLSSGVVVARHEIDYLAPLVHRADPIPIDVWVTRIRAASFELAFVKKTQAGEKVGDERGGLVHRHGELFGCPGLVVVLQETHQLPLERLIIL